MIHSTNIISAMNHKSQLLLGHELHVMQLFYDFFHISAVNQLYVTATWGI